MCLHNVPRFRATACYVSWMKCIVSSDVSLYIWKVENIRNATNRRRDRLSHIASLYGYLPLVTGSVLFCQLDVTTRGWVGLGLSPNGGMKNSDIIVAGVKDGLPYLMVSVILRIRAITGKTRMAKQTAHLECFNSKQHVWNKYLPTTFFTRSRKRLKDSSHQAFIVLCSESERSGAESSDAVMF